MTQKHRRRPVRPAAPEHPAVGTEIELEVSNVAHGGVFVARNEGRVVFVSDTVPGEKVRARVVEARNDSFWRAETLEVLEASPERQPHIWDAASIDRAPENRAGGAEFGHIRLAHQRELKERVIADALSRMAKIDHPVTVEAMAGDEESSGTGWRTRVRLQLAEDGTVGPYSARSHRVVPVNDLPLATAAVAETAPLGTPMPGMASVDVVAPSTGFARLLVNDPTAGKAAPQTIVERVGEREFRLDARGFWQVHRAAPVTLTEAVQSAIDGALFDPRAANLDLYGGVGLLAAAVGDRFGQATRITSVESNDTATDYAAENLAEWVGAQAITDRVERFVEKLSVTASSVERGRQRASTVVLDPPRSGAGKSVVDALLRLAPAQIVYVACDPVAFARDAALFAKGGYALKSLRAFDLFPNTHHVELVASLLPEG